MGSDLRKKCEHPLASNNQERNQAGTVPGDLGWGWFEVSLLCVCACTHFPGGSDGKESTCNAGDAVSVPGLGRSPGEGISNPLLSSHLENPMDRGAWQATVHGVAKSWTRLSD